jgi:hypothetical protein
LAAITLTDNQYQMLNQLRAMKVHTNSNQFETKIREFRTNWTDTTMSIERRGQSGQMSEQQQAQLKVLSGRSFSRKSESDSRSKNLFF